MLDNYEKLTIIHYLQNMLKSDIPHETYNHLVNEIAERLDNFGCEKAGCTALRESFRQAVLEANQKHYYNWKDLGKKALTMFNKLEKKLADSPQNNLQNSLDKLSDLLALSDIEKCIFYFMVRYRLKIFSYIFDELTGYEVGPVELLAKTLAMDEITLNTALLPSGKLLSSGVIITSGDNRPRLRSGWSNNMNSDLDDIYDIPAIVLRAFSKCATQDIDIRQEILGQPLKATLEWQDFAHLGNARDKIAAFLQEAVTRKMRGVNIMLWGPPGTGKTQFCRTLAQKLGFNLYAVGENDDDGNEPSRDERLEAFRLHQILLDSFTPNNLVLFDEMDDIFGCSSGRLEILFGLPSGSTGSKVFLNRLLEDNPIPTIWIVNNPRCLDESTIRRMALAIEIKNPPVGARETVWRRLLEKYQLHIDHQEIKKLAETEISPAIADSAARFASLVGDGHENFRFATEGLIRACKGHLEPKKKISDTSYLPELITADTDQERLAQNIKNSSARDFSLCLYGPPGTGKSAYVRYLAELLDMPIMFKRASNLFNMYVGNTEKLIAKAFEEAADTNSFLIFDEADSLRGDRRHASHSWEISQVNEMLTWMESHPLPFACTTNLNKQLDQAAMRRFTFKCKFDYLARSQLQAAFKHFFNQELPAAEAGKLSFITPGDFAVVRNKARFMSDISGYQDYIELLQHEAENKNENNCRQVGFTR